MRGFFTITIPMLSPTILFNLIIGVINSFQVLVPALLLGGTNPFAPAGGPALHAQVPTTAKSFLVVAFWTQA